jgi:hypothetical protein
VATPVAHFISVETVNVIDVPHWVTAISVLGERAPITVSGIEAVIGMAVKVRWAVKPRAGAYEHPAAEPLGTIVAIRCTGIRGVVIIAVRADRLSSDVDADPGFRSWSSGYTAQCNSGERDNRTQSVHNSSSVSSCFQLCIRRSEK